MQDRYEPTRQLVGWHDFERLGTSYGDADETIEVTLSRIIGEDDLASFRTGLDSTCDNKYADEERIVRTELEQAIVLSIQTVVDLAIASMDQEQLAMEERMK